MQDNTIIKLPVGRQTVYCPLTISLVCSVGCSEVYFRIHDSNFYYVQEKTEIWYVT